MTNKRDYKNLSYMDLRCFITNAETNGDYIVFEEKDKERLFLNPTDFKIIDDVILEENIINIKETNEEIIIITTHTNMYYLQLL